MTGSRLYRTFIAGVDPLSEKVWRGTPWIINVHATDDRRHEVWDWCADHLGEQAQPYGSKPRAGRWREGQATVMGWTWWGFDTEETLREFQMAFPELLEEGAQYQ